MKRIRIIEFLQLEILFLVAIGCVAPSIYLMFCDTPFGDYGDTRGVIWGGWFAGLSEFDKSEAISWPAEIVKTPVMVQPMLNLTVEQLLNGLGLVCGYNFYLILAIFISLNITYIVTCKLGIGKFPSFVISILFCLSPNILSHIVAGHHVFAFTGFIPLSFYITSLVAKNLRPGLLIVLTIILIAQFLMSVYYYWFLILAIFIFFSIYSIADIFSSKLKKISIIYYARDILFKISPIVFSLIFIYIGLKFFNDTELQSNLNSFRRESGEINVFSSRLYEYFFPSISNPIVGSFGYELRRAVLHGSNFFEQTHASWIGGYFIIIAAFLVHRSEFISKFVLCSPKRYLLFVILLITLSLPAHIRIGGIEFNNFNYYLWELNPGIRAYGRLSIFVNFLIVLLVGIAIDVFDKKFESEYKRNFIRLIILFLIWVEYLCIPLQLSVKNDDYLVLEAFDNIPNNSSLIFLPIAPNDTAYFYNYLYLTIYKKYKVGNGISNPSLENYNYVLYDKQACLDGNIPYAIKPYYSTYEAGLSFNCDLVLPKGMVKIFSNKRFDLYEKNP